MSINPLLVCMYYVRILFFQLELNIKCPGGEPQISLAGPSSQQLSAQGTDQLIRAPLWPISRGLCSQYKLTSLSYSAQFLKNLQASNIIQ